jgi:hypothetical protein
LDTRQEQEVEMLWFMLQNMSSLEEEVTDVLPFVQEKETVSLAN